jgi:hypothetical protein
LVLYWSLSLSSTSWNATWAKLSTERLVFGRITTYPFGLVLDALKVEGRSSYAPLLILIIRFVTRVDTPFQVLKDQVTQGSFLVRSMSLICAMTGAISVEMHSYWVEIDETHEVLKIV